VIQGDEELLYGEYLELNEGRSTPIVSSGVARPDAAYVTGVKGGARAHVMNANGEWAHDPGAYSEGEIESKKGGAIVKTVRIEQSYNQAD